MAVPVGKKVYVTLDSGDVIHAWYVPRFLFKRDVVPARRTTSSSPSMPTRPARRSTASAPSCAGVHNSMHFDVLAMTPADFDAWLSKLVEAEKPHHPAAVRRADLQFDAKEITFDVKTLEVAANTPFVIDFKNDDPSAITHDVEIRQSDTAEGVAAQARHAEIITTTAPGAYWGWASGRRGRCPARLRG